MVICQCRSQWRFHCQGSSFSSFILSFSLEVRKIRLEGLLIPIIDFSINAFISTVRRSRMCFMLRFQLVLVVSGSIQIQHLGIIKGYLVFPQLCLIMPSPSDIVLENWSIGFSISITYEYSMHIMIFNIDYTQNKHLPLSTCELVDSYERE